MTGRGCTSPSRRPRRWARPARWPTSVPGSTGAASSSSTGTRGRPVTWARRRPGGIASGSACWWRARTGSDRPAVSPPRSCRGPRWSGSSRCRRDCGRCRGGRCTRPAGWTWSGGTGRASTAGPRPATWRPTWPAAQGRRWSGEGCTVDGSVERSVLWPGTVVRRGEALVGRGAGRRRGHGAGALTAVGPRARSSTRAASWPQAASMSVPRLRRMVALTPRSPSWSRNRRTPSRGVPLVG